MEARSNSERYTSSLCTRQSNAKAALRTAARGSPARPGASFDQSTMSKGSQKIKIPLHMSDRGREMRRQERAKAEEITRNKVGQWWDKHDKAVDSTITRGDYKDLVEFVGERRTHVPAFRAV